MLPAMDNLRDLFLKPTTELLSSFKGRKQCASPVSDPHSAQSGNPLAIAQSEQLRKFFLQHELATYRILNSGPCRFLERMFPSTSISLNRYGGRSRNISLGD